jgi:hypothetical protein
MDREPLHLAIGVAVIAVLVLVARGRLRTPVAVPASGLRDVRREAHVSAFSAWCHAWSLLLLAHAGVLVWGAFRRQRGADEAGWTVLFAAVLLAIAVGLRIAGRALLRWEDAGRQVAAVLAAALAVATFAAGAGAGLELRRAAPFLWSGAGLMGLYFWAGATLLCLPRTARLFTPGYWAEAGGVPMGDAALRAARSRSPFWWAPWGIGLAALLLDGVLKAL